MRLSTVVRRPRTDASRNPHDCPPEPGQSWHLAQAAVGVLTEGYGQPAKKAVRKSKKSCELTTPSLLKSARDRYAKNSLRKS